jgi:hypothetical protein
MARQESDREDLLREATALVERIELAPSHDPLGEHLVIGFRSNGAMSIYFGSDIAYQFNSSGQLRRAYADGLLLKAVRGRLVALERARQDDQVQLLRRQLPDDEQSRFLDILMKRLGDVIEQCNKNLLVTVGQFPPDVDVLSRTLSWLSQCDAVKIAASPHAH